MLSNIKFKAIEDLKMTRAEEYSYNKFLSDSSDDYPKYDEDFLLEQLDGINMGKNEAKDFNAESLVNKDKEDNCKDFYIKQAFSQSDVATALKNVLDLAGEAWAFQKTSDSKDIQIVKDYFFNSGEAMFSNSQIAKDDRD